MCTITGSLKGLLFVVKIFLTLSGFKALAPNPYTVSVGKATNLPYLIYSAAFCKSDSEVDNISHLMLLRSTCLATLSLFLCKNCCKYFWF